MLDVLKFLGTTVLMLFFAVGLAIPGVASIREGQTGTGVVLLVFVALFALAIFGNTLELLDRLRARSSLASTAAARIPPSVPPGTPSNLGPTPIAFFITHHGSATGYHFTDKLTPDGVLAGYRHDDFAPGFVQAYGVAAPPALVERVFASIRTPAFAALPTNISDPRICDGYVLKITARLDGREQVIWLANTTDPLLTPLVDGVYAARPSNRVEEFSYVQGAPPPAPPAA